MNKERRLGRGLEALLGHPIDGQEPHEGGNEGVHLPSHVGVYDVDPNPYQPRREFDDSEIDTLCESLREHGLIQPIVVRRAGDRYQLIAGERRLRAAIKAGWAEIPAHVREVDERQLAELAIVENLQRKDLNALEKAASFQQYLERYQCTQEELAGRLKLDRSTVANMIRLLELPGAVQDAVRKGEITQGHARALLPLGDEREQVAFCERIRTEEMSVRAVEALVKETLQRSDADRLSVVSPEDGGQQPVVKTRNQHLASMEHDLRMALGSKVELRETGKGKGRIVLHFTSHEEFDRIVALLRPGQHYAQAG